MNCPKCGSKPISSDYEGAFECGTLKDRRGWYYSTATCSSLSELRKPLLENIQKLESELNDNRLVLQKLQDERDLANAHVQRLMHAGGRLFEELDDKTPEPNCRCHVFPPCADCTSHASSREALAEWKEAISGSTLKPVVRYVEEVNGGMGPDYAEIYLATGHVIQVNDEGLLLWPSVAAYESGENCQILGSIAFDSKEVKP